MDIRTLQVFYKAGALIPFYTASVFSILLVIIRVLTANISFEEFFDDEYAYELIKIPVLSGLVALFALTIFLNSYKKIAWSVVYSLLCWALAPCCFIAYVLCTQIDWLVINHPSRRTLVTTTYTFCILFLHFIGLIISYIDFRGSIHVMQKKKKEKQ